MDATGSACPTCGSHATQPVEAVWEARHGDPAMAELAQRVAPPTPRAAATKAGQFYAVGCLGLILWTLGSVYALSLVGGRASSVFFLACVAVAGGVIQVSRLFTGTPKPTADQVAALDDWKLAHAEWQRQRICLACREAFVEPT
ncbi:MAG TPA: hypothetical protein VJ782_09385 [Aeromicrobium sp.]|nr:hypothetical protein [Aeromicrobium sp.]